MLALASLLQGSLHLVNARICLCLVLNEVHGTFSVVKLGALSVHVVLAVASGAHGCRGNPFLFLVLHAHLIDTELALVLIKYLTSWLATLGALTRFVRPVIVSSA